MRVDRDEVLQAHDHHRAQRGPDQRAAAAERDHQENLDRRGELEVRRAHEAVVVGPQHAGEAADGAGDHEADVLVQPHVVAERAHARLALADPDERVAER